MASKVSLTVKKYIHKSFVIRTFQYSYTPLLWACERGRHEALKILLQNGADSNAESVRIQHSRTIQMVHTNGIVCFIAFF